jgi:hypothetical protein
MDIYGRVPQLLLGDPAEMALGSALIAGSVGAGFYVLRRRADGDRA